MLTPPDFNELFGGDPKETARKREANRWRNEVWKKLVDAYKEPRSVLQPLYEDSVKNPDDVIRESCNSYELKRIYLHKANVSLQDLLLRPLDNPAINALMGLDINWWSEGAGIVFPVLNNGTWILHTLGHPAGSINGKSVIVIYAKEVEDHDIMAETLKQFIETRK